MATTVSPPLSCNNMACRTSLSTGQVWVTKCSHIFCDPCGATLSSLLACISCKSDLRGHFSVNKKTLEPSMEWKRMVLAGLPPDIVMEICTSAIQFYSNQAWQEVNYLEERITRVMGRVDSVKQYYEEVIAQFKKELEVVETKLEEAHKSNSYNTDTETSSDLSEFVQHAGVDARRLAMARVGQMVGAWGGGSKEEDIWEFHGNSELGEENKVTFFHTAEENTGTWGQPSGEVGFGTAGSKVGSCYELVKAEMTEQNKVKMNGQDLLFMERKSVVDTMNNTSFASTTKTTRASYTQLPLLLNRLVTKRGPKQATSAPRLGQAGAPTKPLSFNQLVPFNNRRF